MKIGLCYTLNKDEYSLVVDKECIEMLKKCLIDQAKYHLQSDSDIELEEAYEAISDWNKLNEMEKKDGTN